MQHTLLLQLLEECEGMARYAFASGKKVPPEAVQTIENFSVAGVNVHLSAMADADAAMHEQGPILPNDDQTKPVKDIQSLVAAHQTLSKLVAPATPRTILFLQAEAETPSVLRALGPVPLVRHMMVAAITCFVLFLGLSVPYQLTMEADTANLTWWVLLCQHLFILASAGLGTSFVALYQANRYIVNSTFANKYVPCYWIKFALGVIAGLLLASVIPDQIAKDFWILAQPLLAILGGFSATAVYRLLGRMIDAVEKQMEVELKLPTTLSGA
ncbi:MAG: hypothetical protein R2932_20385 [Caldilineaceae bacterium]